MKKEAVVSEWLRLLELIMILRSPEGCPWDRRQGKKDVVRHLLEEVYEVVDSLDSKEALKEELGDLLFQILFLVRISEEAGEFTIQNVLKGISDKMIRRHPHVFGTDQIKSVDEVKLNWERIKTHVEGRAKGESILDGLPGSMPSLMRAQKIGERASKIGLNWENREGVFDKIMEELSELKSAVKKGSADELRAELGDLLFSIVNLSRFLEVSADEALRLAIRKFADRCRHVEARLKSEGRSLEKLSPEEMDRLWEEAKKMSGRQ